MPKPLDPVALRLRQIELTVEYTTLLHAFDLLEASYLTHVKELQDWKRAVEREKNRVTKQLEKLK
jgi:hypothetical protein